MRTYTNPRVDALIENYPSGSHRVKCQFKVESHPKKGWRMTRTTENPKTGGWNATKLKTYGGKCVVVDGDDGKTYILQDQGSFIEISRSDFMRDLDNGAYFASSHPNEFKTLKALIESCYPKRQE